MLVRANTGSGLYLAGVQPWLDGRGGAGRARKAKTDASWFEEAVQAGHWGLAIIPIAVLTLSIPTLTYVIGSEALLPFSLSKFAESYGKAEVYVPQILVASSILASLVAGLLMPLLGRDLWKRAR